MSPGFQSCGGCMPNGCTHVTAPKDAALKLFHGLFSKGAFPVMCQQHDASFHVCHEGRQEKVSAIQHRKENTSSRSVAPAYA
jgi:hypothetical protein